MFKCYFLYFGDSVVNNEEAVFLWGSKVTGLDRNSRCPWRVSELGLSTSVRCKLNTLSHITLGLPRGIRVKRGGRYGTANVVGFSLIKIQY